MMVQAAAKEILKPFANDPDDAKVRKLLKREGYDERSLDHITWTALNIKSEEE